MIKPLTDLTSPRLHFNWTPACESAFNLAKTALSNARSLAFPQDSAPLRLATDARDLGVGAVLEQFKDGSWWPLEFWSRKLTPTEMNYSVFDREKLTLFLSIRHFRHMLTGSVFHVLTDHRPLTQALVRKGEPWSPSQKRQLSYISEYTSDLRYVSGPTNTVADALSRDVFEQLSSLTFCTMDEFANAQKKCKDVTLLRNSPGLSCTSKRLPSGNVLHYNIFTNKPRIIVSVSLHKKVVRHLHGIHHPGIRSMRRLVSSNYVWGRIMETVKDMVNHCHQCHLLKTPRKLTPPPSQLPTPARCFNCVHLDIVGPLPESQGMPYLLTMIEWSTRWLEAVPLPSIDANTVTSTFLSHWISRFGIPADVVSDRGLQFTSRTFTSSLQAMGSRVHTTTAYHHQLNGVIERAHRRLKEALAPEYANRRRRHLPGSNDVWNQLHLPRLHHRLTRVHLPGSPQLLPTDEVRPPVPPSDCYFTVYTCPGPQMGLCEGRLSQTSSRPKVPGPI